MRKLSMIRLYKADQVPDHLFEEVCTLVNKIGKAIDPIIQDHEANIIISAFNRFHAAMIVALVTENGLKEAAQTEAIGLMKNIDHIAKTNHFDDGVV